MIVVTAGQIYTNPTAHGSPKFAPCRDIMQRKNCLIGTTYFLNIRWGNYDKGWSVFAVRETPRVFFSISSMFYLFTGWPYTSASVGRAAHRHTDDSCTILIGQRNVNGKR